MAARLDAARASVYPEASMKAGRSSIVKAGFLGALLLFSGCFAAQAPAPVSLYGRTPGAGSSGVHTVSRGETISSISRRYDIVMRDIVLANELSAPFRLTPGQRIKLPPPRQYKARSGDTVYSVSRLFGVSSTELAQINRLSPPYALSGGQVLKLPSESAKGQNVALAAPALSAPGAGVPKPGRKPVYRFEGETGGNADGAQPGVLGQLRRPGAPPGAVLPEDAPPPEDALAQEPPKIVQASAAAKAKIATQTPKRESSRFLRPVSGKLVSSYGSKAGGLHNDGINIAAPRGTAVMAAENGVVVYAGNELKGSGNLVLIRHDGRWMTAYAHMDSVGVKRGDTVRRGQKIGTVGSTGSVETPQLHFEIRRGTEAINPERYLES